MKENDYSVMPKLLLPWYNENKRDLPWRKNPTPYRVWVSEIMLQQTRVEAVKEYYFRFLEALPTIDDLANCPEEKLLKLWEGLGYYSRVRNMQKTAKTLVEKYNGEFPKTQEELKKLSGIGEYTVGSISSIAFGLPVAAVDGNVVRVTSRLFEIPDVNDDKLKAKLKAELEKVYPTDKKGCSDFTQSIMELGATVCKPTAYECDKCPLSAVCQANKHGTQDKFPVLPEKKEKRIEEYDVFVIETKRGVCVEKREKGVLKGMYGFPMRKTGESSKELVRSLVGEIQTVKTQNFKHIFTHIVWKMNCTYLKCDDAPFTAFSKNAFLCRLRFGNALKSWNNYGKRLSFTL